MLKANIILTFPATWGRSWNLGPIVNEGLSRNLKLFEKNCMAVGTDKLSRSQIQYQSAMG
jgi:hypothetical protein